MDINFEKAMREARERTIRELMGVGFSDGKGDWIRLDRMDSEGRVFLKDAVTDESTFIVDRNGHKDLIATVSRSAEGRGLQGWTFVVAGEGERVVLDWASLVLHSGYRVRDLLQKGISHCLINPRLGKEAWT
jgi:hypothetical protein